MLVIRAEIHSHLRIRPRRLTRRTSVECPLAAVAVRCTQPCHRNIHIRRNRHSARRLILVGRLKARAVDRDTSQAVKAATITVDTPRVHWVAAASSMRRSINLSITFHRRGSMGAMALATMVHILPARRL
jgi:hypothetical protein